MAFPYIFESNFEQGTNAEWDSESDTGSKLDFPHVTEFARGHTHVGRSVAPFRGAYCARVQMGDTNDHTLTEGDIDIADGATRYFRWYMYLGEDVAATADDTFSILELQQAGGTVELFVGLTITAATGAVQIGVADGGAALTLGTVPLTKGKWLAIEVLATVSTGGAGVITVFVDGVQYATSTSLTQAAAVGQGVFGTQDTLSTTTGTILLDQFVMDDARIYPIVDRYPSQLLMTKSGHVFVGPGCIYNVSLLSGNGTDCALSIYDTNRANTNDGLKVGVELKNVTENDIVDPAGMPVHLIRGAYVALSGTTPRAMVQVQWAPGYGSAGAVRTIAARLKQNPLEV